MSPSQRGILDILEHGAWCSQNLMLMYGGMRYGARLMELRRMGYRIEAKCLGGTQWVYRLKGRVR